MKKRYNLWKIIWIVGLFSVLLLILYLVIIYKVEWEHKDLNTYLYFYDCGTNLCTSESPQDNYYNKVICEKDICPYITSKNDGNLILTRGETSWIYNYIDGKIIHDDYVNYKHIGDDIYTFIDSNEKQGIFSLNDGVLVQSNYEYIDDYKEGFISYVNNDLYGIDTPNDINNVEPKYQDVVLINDKLFAANQNNLYHLYSYGNLDDENVSKYNYVYSAGDVIFVVNNKKIDILNFDLNSTLLMKIDTFYEYTTEKERESLNFYFDGEVIYFDVFTSETKFTSYKYNVINRKLI